MYYNKKFKKKNLIIITQNKRIKYKYFIEKEIEAGLSLYGWEAKSLRMGKVNIQKSYIQLKNNEAYLFNSIFQPITIISSNFYKPTRERKLLLNKYELNFLFNCTNIKKYTIVILSIYWKYIWAKIKIGIAINKSKYDKREEIKNNEWKRNKLRIMKCTKK